MMSCRSVSILIPIHNVFRNRPLGDLAAQGASSEDQSSQWKPKGDYNVPINAGYAKPKRRRHSSSGSKENSGGRDALLAAQGSFSGQGSFSTSRGPASAPSKVTHDTLLVLDTGFHRPALKVKTSCGN